MATRRRRRRRNPTTSDVKNIVTIAAIGVGAYLVYQIYLQVSAGAASLSQCLMNPLACLQGNAGGGNNSSTGNAVTDAATLANPATAIGNEIGSSISSILGQ